MELKKGFYPALGTPLDENGMLVEESFRKEIELMIQAGAAGMLAMGSMGAEDALVTETYRKTAQVAVSAVNGRVPLFIGAMDNSVFRIKERFQMLEGLDFTGVVLTTPFYSTFSSEKLIKFFQEAADAAPKPVYLYDLPVVTKQKITYDMVKVLLKHPNIKGIKTGDIVLARQILRNYPEFDVLFSNLDIFDVAGSYGLPRVLDGMFTCTPKNTAAFNKCYLENDMEGAGKYLDNIIALRDAFLPTGLWPDYTVAMNLLGMEGKFGKGFTTSEFHESDKEMITEMMRKIGEL